MHTVADLSLIMRDKRLSLAVVVLLVFFIVITLFRAVGFFISDYHAGGSGTAVYHAKLEKIPEFASYHLFGVYRARYLPQTQLQLKLEGVFFAVPAESSQALISASGGSAKLYNVGDSIPGGAKIRTVLANSIVLRHNGKLETLPLIRPKLRFSQQPRDIFD